MSKSDRIGNAWQMSKEENIRIAFVKRFCDLYDIDDEISTSKNE